MRTIFLLSGLIFISYCYGQKNDELLVYSLKGEATVIEGNTESKVRIGKVLKPGATIKTKKDAKLTLVCKEGRPISVTREGSFPVLMWKDSCATRHSSITNRYFQYIWDQMYVRSDDYKKDYLNGVGLADAPVRGPDEKEILFPEALDTINYIQGEFPLTWTTSFEYNGYYVFVLTNVKTKKIVYRDSTQLNFRSLISLRKQMKPGNVYSWSVGTPVTGLVNGGIIRYLNTGLSQRIPRLMKEINVPEDTAAQYFRVGYMLEQDHYLADAYTYYRKAVKADPATSFYAEMLMEFRKRFYITEQR